MPRAHEEPIRKGFRKPEAFDRIGSREASRPRNSDHYEEDFRGRGDDFSKKEIFDLKKKLAEKDFEIEELKQKIRILQKERDRQKKSDPNDSRHGTGDVSFNDELRNGLREKMMGEMQNEKEQRYKAERRIHELERENLKLAHDSETTALELERKINALKGQYEQKLHELAMDNTRAKNEADWKNQSLTLENGNLKKRIEEMNANDLKSLQGKSKENAEIRKLVDMHESDLATIDRLTGEKKMLENHSKSARENLENSKLAPLP
jgi:hypothetical protein